MTDLRVGEGLPDDDDVIDAEATEEDEGNRIGVGFGPLGGVQLQVEDKTVTLDPERAFVVAALIHTHASILIQMQYQMQAQQAMEEARIRDQILKGTRPGGPSGLR